MRVKRRYKLTCSLRTFKTETSILPIFGENFTSRKNILAQGERVIRGQLEESAVLIEEKSTSSRSSFKGFPRGASSIPNPTFYVEFCFMRICIAHETFELF